jgi:hypothetical protein
MSISTASREGFLFENTIYDEIKKYFIEGYILRNEKEIKDEYGSAISGIDIELYNIVKTKDKDTIPSKYIFIQLKWKDSPSPISDINHFIQCCSNIIKSKNLDENNILCIYGTKVPVSGPSLEALKRLKNSENIYISDMNICINMILNKILKYYSKKTIKYEPEFIDEYDDSTNYEDLKKNILIKLVVKRYNYKKSQATKYKHADLVQILVTKNIINDPIEIYETEKIIKVEYDEPLKRNVGENKSKLLKKGSELYNHINKLRIILGEKGFKHVGYAIDLHTEVLNNNESLQIFLSRVASLEGKEYDIKNKNNYDIVGRAVAFMLGDLDGYDKDAKITIAFLPDKDLKQALKVIYDNI